MREALAAALSERPELRMGYFVQPNVMAPTSHAEALTQFLRDLITGIVPRSTASPAPRFFFETFGANAPGYYAMSVLAEGDTAAPRIGSLVDAAADASGVRVWEIPADEGEGGVMVCFAL